MVELLARDFMASIEPSEQDRFRLLARQMRKTVAVKEAKKVIVGYRQVSPGVRVPVYETI